MVSSLWLLPHSDHGLVSVASFGLIIIKVMEMASVSLVFPYPGNGHGKFGCYLSFIQIMIKTMDFLFDFVLPSLRLQT